MLKQNDEHAFAIKDEDLFRSPMGTDLRTLKCDVCGKQPGQGVHTPPKPPLSRSIADEVSRTLSAALTVPVEAAGPRAAFTAIQNLRGWLEKYSEAAPFADADASASYAFDRIDDELDKLLTGLHKLGWDDQDRS